MSEKYKRYSETFKREVVSEYEAGNSMKSLRKKYGIKGGSTIHNWIKRYGRQGFRHEIIRIQTTAEANQVNELEKKVKELQQALGKVTLEKLKLESTLEELQETFGDVVKKNALSSSDDSTRKPTKDQSVK